MTNAIMQGDTVSIYWEYVEHEYNLTVLRTPNAPGDSYDLVREDGTIVYVQSFSKMVKLNKFEEPPF